MTVTGSRVSPDGARPCGRVALFAGIARSEWVKLRTVRSTYWTLLAAAACMIGFGAVLSAAYARHYGGAGPAARAAFDPAAYSLSGFFLAQLAVGVLGVVVISSEYATGSMRSTLAAAPQRAMVLAAKVTVFGAVAAAAGTVSSFGAFFAGQVFLSRQHIGAQIGGPGALRSVIGAGLYLAVVGLLGLGLGAVVRRTAGGIAAVAGLVVFVPVAVGALPTSWQDTISRYLPSDAGQAVIGHTKFTPPVPLLSPWAGFGVLCAYAVAALVAGGIALSRRDA